MKICYIARDYTLLGYGGISTYLHNTTINLIKRGHEVHVICESFSKERDFIEGGVHVYPVTAGSLVVPRYILREIFSLKRLDHYIFRIANIISFNIKCYFKFRNLNRKIKFDILEVEDGAGVGLLLTLNKSPPVVTKFHTPWTVWEKLNNTYKNNFFFKFLTFIEKLQFKRSIGLNANSYAMKEKILSIFNIRKNPISILYYGININNLIALTNNKKSFISGDYLLYFGRLEERKGCMTLADALPFVLRKYKNLRVVFIGREFEGWYRKQRENIIMKNKRYRDRVIFLDHIPHEDLMPIIKGAKIVILPSYWEAFGYTCLESMALGKIVIASSGSGFEEQIQKDGKGGFLFRPRDSNELAKKIIKILKMPKKKLNTISKNARKRAMDFDNSKITPKLIDYYKTIIKNHKKTK